MEPQRSISMKLTDVTPNLIVSDIDRSTTFYREVLGFSVVTTVPDQTPFVFVWLQRDGIKVFLNAAAGVKDDVPELGTRAVGGDQHVVHHARSG
jgi:catechol 2,3-dioxygenase-like lactoylglutathione lyase family enzyme